MSSPPRNCSPISSKVKPAKADCAGCSNPRAFAPRFCRAPSISVSTARCSRRSDDAARSGTRDGARAGHHGRGRRRIGGRDPWRGEGSPPSGPGRAWPGGGTTVGPFVLVSAILTVVVGASPILFLGLLPLPSILIGLAVGVG